MNAAAAVCADLSALDEPESLAGFTRWRADGAAESSLRLAGMHCAACAGLIEAALGAVPGVLSVRVNAALGLAQVRWHPAKTRISALVGAVRAAGYDAAPDLAADARALRQRDARQALWRLFVAGFCAMQVMMFATPIYLAAPGEMAPDQLQLLHWGSWLLTLPVLLFAAAPFFSGAWRALRQRRIGMDLPVALGIAVTFVASTGAAFDPGGIFGREVYFDSLVMFVSFLLAARWLEQRARHRAASALEDSAPRCPSRPCACSTMAGSSGFRPAVWSPVIVFGFRSVPCFRRMACCSAREPRPMSRCSRANPTLAPRAMVTRCWPPA
jgi:P-type Cu2+ transporter